MMREHTIVFHEGRIGGVWPAFRDDAASLALTAYWFDEPTALRKPLISRLVARGSHVASALLHRHALGQVAGLVHVAAPAHGDVVGQELQREWSGAPA